MTKRLSPSVLILIGLAIGVVLGPISVFTQIIQPIANVPGTSRLRGSIPALSVELVDASGNQITTFGGSGGTSATDDGLFTLGAANSVTPAGYLADEVASDVVDEGDVGVARMTVNRIMLHAIANPDGVLRATIRDVTGANDALNVAITASDGTQISSFGGGVQYTEGDTDATITGTALIYQDSGVADTLRAALGTLANGLQVDVTRGVGVGITSTAIYTENATDATIDGIPCMMEDTGNTLVPCQGSVANGLKVQATVSGSVDTELPAATAPGLTGISTPTAPAVINYNYCSNGTTWDACLGTPDPCAKLATTTTPISVAATRTVIIAAVSAKKNYICSFDLVAGAAEISNIVEGTGTTCQTGTAALWGSTTAANGASFAINGGIAKGNGDASVLVGKTANVDTCLVNNSTGRVSGSVTWVQN